MTCAPTDRIMQTLRTRVPGAADPMLELELFNTIDEFLRRTGAWQFLTEIELEDGVNEYPLGLPGDAVLVRTLGVAYNGQPVANAASSVVQSSVGTLVPKDIRPDGDVDLGPYITDLQGATGLFSYSLFRPNYISVNNQPVGEENRYPLQLALALSISQSCIECSCGDWDIPEWMFDMYFQDWLDGVLGRMYGMPSKPWSNLALAQYHAKRFRNEMAFRKQEARRGFAYNVPTWRYPRAGWP